MSYLGLTLTAAALWTPPAAASTQTASGFEVPNGNGNSRNSGNFRNWGRAVNSGNFVHTDGAVSSGNTFGGGNIANGPQRVTEGRNVRSAR
ncbi:hypothetical protein ABGB18_01690 [Nonomuraea sp. B12E4]|uniref:hypothetical protein n=1 Tax=Nonomuraea sp. B12E4 TaxID=3153564 RepID=UPI00325D0985